MTRFVLFAVAVLFLAPDADACGHRLGCGSGCSSGCAAPAKPASKCGPGGCVWVPVSAVEFAWYVDGVQQGNYHSERGVWQPYNAETGAWGQATPWEPMVFVSME